ncbi:MAG: hypothetical protein KKC38_01440, partial [Nanoarchaeota archaeon]|nr:hypothetical protein [Nanoarchaeota archaeon]
MVKKLIDEIKEKLKEFKTKEDKVKYLKKVLEETDNEELKELVLELIEELENSLEQIVEQAPVESKPIQPIKLQQDPEYNLSERSQTELTRDPIREPTREPVEAHYSRNENTQYVIAPTAITQTADQSDLVSRLRGNLRRKNLLPSGNLVPTTAVKEQMMVEIKREFNNNISSERLQNYVDLFTT